MSTAQLESIEAGGTFDPRDSCWQAVGVEQVKSSHSKSLLLLELEFYVYRYRIAATLAATVGIQGLGFRSSQVSRASGPGAGSLTEQRILVSLLL